MDMKCPTCGSYDHDCTDTQYTGTDIEHWKCYCMACGTDWTAVVRKTLVEITNVHPLEENSI